ncbi:hypothetical protein GCM10025857_33030 [Alicyclobacillus contaminans]|nr:hypothetical protein GCM10025857_33030 [Alicyclobacillus contaminans]
MVTVDNGIRADDAIRYATDLGLDVIVTDHHEPGDERPSGAVAVVHWAYAGGHGDARTLSGAGVAWKVAQALLSAADLWDAAELEDWLVGLAALGAIADMMPMSVENRKLVSTGLAALRRCRRAGWLALCQSAGLDTADITPIKVAFTIAPRLNAAGRMGTASVALELLMAEDEVEAAARAAQIETWNQLRKAETERAYQEAYAQYTQMHPADDAPVVLVAGPWHLGVAGIVAARLVNQVQKPAVVLCGDGEGMWRGSGRATTGFDLHQVVSQCSAHLAHFGGHEAAIGCAVHPHLLDAFRADLYHAASAWVGGASEADKPVADDYLPLAEANLEMLGWVERFAPHGPDNPPLTFYVGPVKLVRVTEMAGGRHARLRVREGRHEADLVWFRVPEEVLSWPSGTAFAAVVEMERNTWQGRTTAQLRVLDGRLLKHPWLREELALLYRLLRARRKLTIHEVAESVPKRTPSEIQVALDTFAELGFAEASESAYHVVESVVQRDLRDSVHYQSHLRRCAEALSL